MTDHPLDEFYKQKFLRLKAEKEGRPYIPPDQQNEYQESQNTANLIPNFGNFQSAGISNKTQDPLIRAEAEKKIREQRLLFQQQFQQSIEEIDRNF